MRGVPPGYCYRLRTRAARKRRAAAKRDTEPRPSGSGYKTDWVSGRSCALCARVLLGEQALDLFVRQCFELAQDFVVFAGGPELIGFDAAREIAESQSGGVDIVDRQFNVKGFLHPH